VPSSAEAPDAASWAAGATRLVALEASRRIQEFSHPAAGVGALLVTIGGDSHPILIAVSDVGEVRPPTVSRSALSSRLSSTGSSRGRFADTRPIPRTTVASRG
jgi:hypothetical protein